MISEEDMILLALSPLAGCSKSEGALWLCLTLISFSLVRQLKATLLAADFAGCPWANRRGVTASACLNAAQRPFNLVCAQCNVCSTAGSGSPALAVCLSQAEAGLDRETVFLTGRVTSGLLIAWCRRWSFSHQTADGWYLVPEPSCIFYCTR